MTKNEEARVRRARELIHQAFTLIKVPPIKHEWVLGWTFEAVLAAANGVANLVIIDLEAQAAAAEDESTEQ
jgi:hypothetical protein